MTQNTGLWIFAFIALAYIFWIDLRRFLEQRKKEKSKEPKP
jgi:hypothetical protein